MLRPMKVPHSVAVIGGGFSGAMTVVQLIRSGYKGSLLLFERDALGRGIAYGTRCDKHLLNVPASGMSAFPDDAGHFQRWLEGRNPASSATTFAPRRLYGEYIAELLQAAKEEAAGRVRIVRAEVLSCKAEKFGTWTLTTDSRLSFQAATVILATGHTRPQSPIPVAAALEETRQFIANPWQPDLFAGLQAAQPVLLIGSGLTAADVVLEAQDSGFQGPLYLLSRRGFLPRVHALAFKPAPTPVVTSKPNSARALLHALRQVIEVGHENWRSAIDSLRPETQALWKALGPVEQKRFLRHVRPYWEVHRHRVAPEVADELEALLRHKKLIQLSGRLESIEPSGGAVLVRFRSRPKGASQSITVQRAINCTGPAASLAMCSTPLTQQLLADGYCKLDDLGIGLDVDENGRARRSDGAVLPSLLTIGSLRKGILWETTAVRELRDQAKRLAELIVASAQIQNAA